MNVQPNVFENEYETCRSDVLNFDEPILISNLLKQVENEFRRNENEQK